MPTVTIEEAQAKLPELISALIPGEEMWITSNQHVVAKLIASPRPTGKPRQPGSAIGKIEILSDDDEHLKDFAEYM